MREIIYSAEFKKGWKKLEKKHYNQDKFKAVYDLLEKGLPLPGKYKNHYLKGNLQGYKECHIEDNWLLIYKETDTSVILVKTGTHDDLYK